MSEWEVTPKFKKSVEEHELWQKDDMVIRRITGFRSGKFIITNEDNVPPVLEETQAPWGMGINMFDCGHEAEMEFIDDGWYENIVWPDDMDEDEQERLQELWDADMYDAWEEEGWFQYETECWFTDEIEITQIDT